MQVQKVWCIFVCFSCSTAALSHVEMKVLQNSNWLIARYVFRQSTLKWQVSQTIHSTNDLVLKLWLMHIMFWSIQFNSMLYFRLNVFTHYRSIVIHTIRTFLITMKDNPTDNYIIILILTKIVKALDSPLSYMHSGHTVIYTNGSIF